MVAQRTIVHLVRHGEVENPAGLLYGRLPDYHLSELGREMADRVAEDLRGRDIVHLRCSPLERAQETMEPIAEALGLPVTTDGRVIEAANYLEGLKVSFGETAREPAQLVVLPQPAQAHLGRAVHRDRRPDAAGYARCRRSGRRARGRHRLPSAADLDGPVRRRGPPPGPRPAQAAVHPGQRHLVHLPGRPGHLGELPRAGGRSAQAAPDQEVRRGGVATYGPKAYAAAGRPASVCLLLTACAGTGADSRARTRQRAGVSRCRAGG